MSIKNPFILIAALSITAQAGLAQVTGINSTVIQPSTDVTVTVPFTQNSEGSFAATGTTATTINVAGPLTSGQFGTVTVGSGGNIRTFTRFYLRMTSGSANGRWSSITANDATSFTLEDTTFLAQIVAGNTFNVYRHQTLASVFPDEFENYSFKRSVGIQSNGTQVIFRSLTAIGINKSASQTFFFHSSGTWRQIGVGTTPFDEQPIEPQRSFIIRNQTPSGAAASDLVFTSMGRVETGTQVTRLPFGASGTDNDLGVGIGVPVDITLRQLNLAGTSGFVTTTNILQVRDTVLVFDNSQPGLNKSSSASYFVLSNASTGNVPQWRRIGGGSTNFDNQIIPAGAAIQIRKKAVSPGGVANWTQTVPF